MSNLVKLTFLEIHYHYRIKSGLAGVWLEAGRPVRSRQVESRSDTPRTVLLPPARVSQSPKGLLKHRLPGPTPSEAVGLGTSL